jgi:hypothetical protein
MSDKNYLRNNIPSNDVNDAAIDEELSKLILEDLDDYRAMIRLKQKYNDNKMVDAVFDAFKKKTRDMNKYASKFKQLILQKYGKQNLSQRQLIEKAKKYAKHHNIADNHVNLFVKKVLFDEDSHFDGYTAQYNVMPNTPITKLLGQASIYQETIALNYSATDAPILNEIIRLEEATKGLHRRIVLQSITYEDCSITVIEGMNHVEHYKIKDNYSFIHPIIAALFIPKVPVLEKIMLMANIGTIVSTKNKGKYPNTQPDNELYWNFLHDPSESVCDANNALVDLKNRFILQTKIWDSVMHIRQGHFYDERAYTLLDALDNCDDRFFDYPDLALVQDEGTIMKKILGAFGLRTIVASTSIIYNGNSAYNQLVFRDPFLNSASPNVMSLMTIPMLVLRLPLKISGVQQQMNTSLNDTFTQVQWFVNPDKSIVPKAQTIIHAEDVIFFYVVRRHQSVELRKLGMKCNFTTLPMTISHLETLNNAPVDFDFNIDVADDSYTLRSVVCVQTAPKTKLIVGSTALILKPASVAEQEFEDRCYIYDPISATIGYRNDAGQVVHPSPLLKISKMDLPLPQPATATDGTFRYYPSFHQIARTQGTIFMYVKNQYRIC